MIGDHIGAGGEIVSDGDAVFDRAELIVKVKEPLAAERKKLSRGQVLFTYLHLAPDSSRFRMREFYREPFGVSGCS